jgi:hypothetical protein
MENKLIVGLLIVLCAAFIVLSSIIIVDINKENVKIVIPTADEIASKIVIPEQPVQPNVDATKIDEIYDKTFKEDNELKLQNDTTKKLVLDEIALKAFKKELVEVLNDNSVENQSIEDYKSIESIYSIVIKDVEIDDDDNAVVTVEVKVKFINDEDEELEYRAKLIATFDVTDLDVEDITDAEAELDTLEVSRIYEN